MRAGWLWVAGFGCVSDIGLPPPEEPPIVGRPFVPCDNEDDGARVACVIDGDTLDLGVCGEPAGERVRLLGIDAPETEKPDEPAECFAEEASAFLRDLLEGQTLTMSHDRNCVGYFGRTLGYLWLRGDALDRALENPDVDRYLWSWYLDPDEPAILVNELLLGLGYVDAFPEVSGALVFQNRLDEALSEARSNRRGLWGACVGGSQ